MYPHQELFEQAKQAYAEGRYPEAARGFFEAWVKGSREAALLFTKDNKHAYGPCANNSVLNEAPEHKAESLEAEGERLFNLALSLHAGIGVERDLPRAVELYRQAANTRHAAALYNLGYCYERGKGVQQDLPKAVRLYKQAADMGHAAGLDNLGECYYYGKGVEQDLPKAVELYKQAADMGHANALNNLGYCYKHGKGVQQDYAMAAKLYEQAADMGYANALNNLGNCYARGKGVQQDLPKAVELYEQAADMGYANALNNLGNCYERGKGVQQDYSMAAKLYKQAADMGYAAGLGNLGECYYYGKGVEQDLPKAVELYEQAADMGYANALNNLGNCYASGMGVERDYSMAAKLYKQAADMGCTAALHNLGNYYKHGKGVQQDDFMAAKLYRWAARGYRSLGREDGFNKCRQAMIEKLKHFALASFCLLLVDSNEDTLGANIGDFFRERRLAQPVLALILDQLQYELTQYYRHSHGPGAAVQLFKILPDILLNITTTEGREDGSNKYMARVGKEKLIIEFFVSVMTHIMTCPSDTYHSREFEQIKQEWLSAIVSKQDGLNAFAGASREQPKTFNRFIAIMLSKLKLVSNNGGLEAKGDECFRLSSTGKITLELFKSDTILDALDENNKYLAANKFLAMAIGLSDGEIKDNLMAAQQTVEDVNMTPTVGQIKLAYQALKSSLSQGNEVAGLDIPEVVDGPSFQSWCASFSNQHAAEVQSLRSQHAAALVVIGEQQEQSFYKSLFELADDIAKQNISKFSGKHISNNNKTVFVPKKLAEVYEKIRQLAGNGQLTAKERYDLLKDIESIADERLELRQTDSCLMRAYRSSRSECMYERAAGLLTSDFAKEHILALNEQNGHAEAPPMRPGA